MVLCMERVHATVAETEERKKKKVWLHVRKVVRIRRTLDLTMDVSPKILSDFINQQIQTE